MLNTCPSIDHFIISQLSGEVHGLVSQHIFAQQEFYALQALMEAYPDYCPYEVLFSAWSDKTIEQARQIIHDAIEELHLDSTLNPLRNLLARCRPRLHDFGIDVGSRRGLGYQLQRVTLSTRSYEGQNTLSGKR
jgi:biotin operon repressor